MKNFNKTQKIQVQIEFKGQGTQVYTVSNQAQLIQLAELVKTGKLGVARIVKGSIKLSDTATISNGYQTTIVISEAA